MMSTWRLAAGSPRQKSGQHKTWRCDKDI